jgi:hypothetical protein
MSKKLNKILSLNKLNRDSFGRFEKIMNLYQRSDKTFTGIERNVLNNMKCL